MYGGSGKLGRGGRGGHGPKKRNIHSTFHAPPVHRPSAPLGGGGGGGGGGRIAVPGVPRNRTNLASSSGGPTTSAAEETFSLVRDNFLNFGMIIRLAPNLVEEIKQLEEQGGTARIKFDANGNNPSGNVIEVGGKDFRFTWSAETGEFCDIYEERRSGEDGNGLLVESGCAWRKLSVQRELDESIKNHVKMRSEEAERKLNSRKAIILEPGGPSMKSQVKALQAAEVNPRRMHFNKKKVPPFKKQKTEPPSGALPRPVYRPGLPSITPSKSRQAASPILSPPEHFGAPSSPFLNNNLSKGHASGGDLVPTTAINNENATSTDKELPSRVGSGVDVVQDKPGHKRNLGAKPSDLRNMLISLLMENPKGMSLKALEKSIGDTIPNSVRQIEPIIKKIATFQAPGRYLLKPGVELEGFRKHSSESGSSPENNHHHQTSAAEEKFRQIPVAEPTITAKADSRELEEQEQLTSKLEEESKASEKVDILDHSPDPFVDKKVSDNSDGPVGSPSDSGSDSDSESDSSDSRSDSGSHSRSRSRSPVGSVSGSSSDSDASSSSKEGSDEDVNIMTSDDDKESKRALQVIEPGLPGSPNPLKTPDGRQMQNGIDEKAEDHGSDIVEIEKDSPVEDEEGEVAVIDIDPNREGENPIGEMKQPSPEHHKHQGSKVPTENLHSEKENMVKNYSKHGRSDNSTKSLKGKTKRGFDEKLFDDNPEHTKRFKAENLTQPQTSGCRSTPFSESYKLSSDGPPEGPLPGPIVQVTKKLAGDETEFGLQKGHDQATPVKSISDSQQGRRYTELGLQAKALAVIEKPGKHIENMSHNFKYSERSFQMQDGFPIQKNKDNREAQVGEGHIDEKMSQRSSKVGGVGDGQSTPAGSLYRRHGESVVQFKDTGLVTNSQIWSSPKSNKKTDMDKSPMTGQGRVLQREHSDLELGELREPVPEETSGLKKQFERNSSFKWLENKPTSSDCWNLDKNKVKTAAKATESRKSSPPQNNVISDNLDGLHKKRTPEYYVEDLTRPTHRVVQSQPQHLQKADHTEFEAQLTKVPDSSNKSRSNEVGLSHGIDPEGREESHRKEPASASQQHDTKRVVVPRSNKENKKQRSNILAGLDDRRNETSLTESNDGGQTRKESSPDENSLFYLKYEKEEPELKGPIKDFSQYREYVQEYREKYDPYISLNKILESYRIEFGKLGKDLQNAKGRDIDRYFSIKAQLQESYRQCGMRHKRLKKIFIVLHQELQCLKQMIKDFVVSYKKD